MISLFSYLCTSIGHVEAEPLFPMFAPLPGDNLRSRGKPRNRISLVVEQLLEIAFRIAKERLDDLDVLNVLILYG